MPNRFTTSGTGSPAGVPDYDEPIRGASLIHICIGDPQLNHLKRIEQAAQSGKKEFDWWNITKRARPGDMVIFYLTSPVSAFVATGVVERKVGDNDENEVAAEQHFYGRNCFWISKAAMLPRRVSLNEAKAQFPEWPYLKRPIVISIPNGSTPSDLVERFLRFLRAPVPPTQKSADLDDPPGRIATMTYRILRDTERAREVKRMHAHECQICGETIELPDGGRYAEAHHVRPLGSGH